MPLRSLANGLDSTQQDSCGTDSIATMIDKTRLTTDKQTALVGIRCHVESRKDSMDKQHDSTGAFQRLPCLAGFLAPSMACLSVSSSMCPLRLLPFLFSDSRICMNS